MDTSEFRDWPYLTAPSPDAEREDRGAQRGAAQAPEEDGRDGRGLSIIGTIICITIIIIIIISLVSLLLLLLLSKTVVTAGA